MRGYLFSLVKGMSLLGMMHFAAALAVQVDRGIDVEYYLGAFALVACAVFAWADARSRYTD